MTFESDPATAAIRGTFRLIEGGKSKRVVAAGKSGPTFGARAGVEYVVGDAGLRSGALVMPDEQPEPPEAA